MSPSRRVVTLVLYRDAAQLRALDRPGLVGFSPALVVELALRSRLRPAGLGAEVEVGVPGAVASGWCEAPVVFASEAAVAVGAALLGVRRQVNRVAGPVVLVCHVDDAAAFVGGLSEVSDLRLLWHPADETAGISGLVEAVGASGLGRQVGLHPVYFSSLGRGVAMEDWARVMADPVLARLAALGRRRARRSGSLARVRAAFGG